MVRRLFTAGLLVLTGIGCDWRAFDDLSDSVWVDVRSAADSAAGITIGSAALVGDSGFEGPRFMRIGAKGPTLTSFAYDQNGNGTKAEEELDRTALVKDGAVLAATRSDAAMVVAALERNAPARGYALVGDFGQDFDQSGSGVTTAAVWTGLAISSQNLVSITADGTLSVYGSGSSPQLVGACVIDTSLVLGTPTPNASLGIMESPPRLIVGSDGSVLDLALPTDVAEEGNPPLACEATALETEIVNGPIFVGDVIPGTPDNGPDIVGVELGTKVAVIRDYISPGNVTPAVTIPAPSGSSTSWGLSLAVGDFDGDGDNDLAVGDPEQETVHLFDLGAADMTAVTRTLTADGAASGYGRAVAAAPFARGEKDVLMVASDDQVFTYFRVFAEGDADPRE